MRNITFFLLLIASVSAKAQDCKGFFFFNSSEVQMTIYDKKGGASGTLTYTISDARVTGSSASASFTSEMVNEKGKSISKSAGSVKCEKGSYYVDARVGMPQEQMQQFKDMQVKASDVYLEYPSSLSANQVLPDANFKMEVFNKSGELFSTVTYDAINRKVVTSESITTPAGTWECWKITYDARFKSSLAPLNIGIPFNFSIVEWFAPGFGIVKSESYNKNGKLMGSMAISSVKK